MQIIRSVQAVPSDFEQQEYSWDTTVPLRPKALQIWLSLMRIPRIGQLFGRTVARRFSGTGAAGFAPGFRCLYGNLIVGKDVYLGDSFCVDYAPIVCADHVYMSFENLILTSTHDLTDFKRVIARPIVLEENVWITSRCTVLGGVRIGANSVIAAGSIVTRSIPANVLAGGNPARVIKEISRCKQTGLAADSRGQQS